MKHKGMINVKNKKNVSVSERNYGIDLLRIVAMMMVVLIHVNNYGGVMAASSSNVLNNKIAWFLQSAAYVAVNCYAMISGYVGMNSKHKYANVMYLYLQVVFYLVISAAIFYFFKPGTVTIKNIFERLLPFVYDHYWYFTSYFCMSFFIPFMNKFLKKLDKKEAKALTVTIVLLFSVLPSIFRKDLFRVIWGYSVMWLSALYMLGGCIKIMELEKKIKKSTAIIVYLIAVSITFGSTFIKQINMDNFLFAYTSPTVLISSGVLFIIFAQLNINEKLKKVISFFAPLAFGVYLIHTEPLIWQHIFFGKFMWFGNANPIIFILYTLLVTIAVWLCCSMIDYIRLDIFNLLRLKKLCINIENKLIELFNKNAD